MNLSNEWPFLVQQSLPAPLFVCLDCMCVFFVVSIIQTIHLIQKQSVLRVYCDASAVISCLDGPTDDRLRFYGPPLDVLEFFTEVL